MQNLTSPTFLSSFLSMLLSVQFSSVSQSCLTFCDPMNCSTPGLPVHHQLREFTQTHSIWCYINGILFSIYFLCYPLLMHIDATYFWCWFCICSFAEFDFDTNFFFFLVESLGFSVYKSLPSARRDDFLLSF